MSDINNVQITDKLISNDACNNNDNHDVSIMNEEINNIIKKICDKNNNLNNVNETNNSIDTVLYHSSDIISDTGKMLNNKKHGVWKRYDKDGNIIMICEYQNNMKHGDCVYFQTRNGVTYAYEKGRYFNNKEIGWWKQYNSKGETVYAEYVDDN